MGGEAHAAGDSELVQQNHGTTRSPRGSSICCDGHLPVRTERESTKTMETGRIQGIVQKKKKLAPWGGRTPSLQMKPRCCTDRIKSLTLYRLS
jgi:hypothetical protein